MAPGKASTMVASAIALAGMAPPAKAAASAEAASAGARFPVAEGCFAITSRSECCFYSDGREGTEFAGQECVPAKTGRHFSIPGAPEIESVCQPACWAKGACLSEEDQTEVIDTCAAVPAEATSSGRTKLPGGHGCFEVLDRASCCLWSDGRPEEPWNGEECVPALESTTFSTGGSEPGPVCQPRSWVWGLLSDVGDQSERMGVCGEAPAPTLPKGATVSKTGARIEAGGDLRFYVIGSSNAAWQTWPDQLHAMLLDLGYNVRLPHTNIPGEADGHAGRQVPKCADADTYEGLATPRLGRPGWSTWGFSYESKDDCDEHGFRSIAGWNVSCTNGWACMTKWTGDVPLVPVSAIAKGVRDADVVILANYVNDARNAFHCPHDCYGSNAVPNFMETADITAEDLKRTIQAIHAENPEVIVLVLARYAENERMIYVKKETLEKVSALNMAIKEKVVDTEPNTFFVDYAFPQDVNIFQTLNAGHANCRGDKVMATSVIDAMFEHDIIAKSLDIGPESCLGRADCSALDLPCCQRSALCYVDAEGECSPYSPGEQ